MLTLKPCYPSRGMLWVRLDQRNIGFMTSFSSEVRYPSGSTDVEVPELEEEVDVPDLRNYQEMN